MGLWIILASILLVVLEGLASYFLSGNFLPSQVVARWGKVGIAFIAHGGMWGDLIPLPLIMAWVIVKHSGRWSVKMICTMAALGVLVTLANHLLLIFTQTIPDPLGWQKEKWSIPIGLHFIYMSTYVALALLFYFTPGGVGTKEAVIVSVVLGLHMAAGTHIPLGLLNLWYHWSWCPDFLSGPVLPILTAVIWGALVTGATIAGGTRAGLSVAGIAIVLGVMVLCIIKMAPAQSTG